MKQPNLETDRLFLRPFRFEDADSLVSLLKDKEISEKTRFIPYPYTFDMAKTWIGSHLDLLAQKKSMTYAVEHKKTKALIGTVGLTSEDKFSVDSSAEVGYWIGKQHWRLGYGTESVNAMISYGFYELKLGSIFASVMQNNLGSIKLLQKLGMKKTGKKEQYFEARKKTYNVFYYGITAQQYLSSNEHA